MSTDRKVKTDITIPMIKRLYNVYQEISKSKIKLEVGIKILTDLSMNRTSIIHYFKRLDYYIINKNVYRFSLNSEHLLYFLSQIHKDYGDPIYKKALSAVKETIKYYKDHNKKGIPKIYENTYNLLVKKKIDIQDVYSHYKNSDEEYLQKKILISGKNKTISKNKSQSVSSSSKLNADILPKAMLNEEFKKQLYEIIQCIKDKIISINEICENNDKKPIFADSKTLKLWRAIEKPCTSEEIFINFTLKLYILIYETTREKNQEYTKNNGKPFYEFYLPFEFIKDGTPTKHFMEVVGTLRHKFAHREPEYNNIIIKKMKYKDVLKEIFENKTPRSSEDYQKLQIEVLKKLNNVLEILQNLI